MSRRDLHVALEPLVRQWLRTACTWEELAIGDYRFVIFSIEVAPETEVYVQFWSEPLEPVVWEVSSGKWNQSHTAIQSCRFLSDIHDSRPGDRTSDLP